MSIFQFTNDRTRPFAPQPLGQIFNRMCPQARTHHATWPIRSNSTDEPIKFTRLSKKRAVRLYRNARDFERQTRQPGRQDGAIGRNGLKVLEALIFDFLNYVSGQLWPSVAAIARKANMSERSVRRGLDMLKAAGVLDWQRRKASILAFGQVLWFQLTNAYQVRGVEYWRGYVPPVEPPPPHGDTWGATPPLPSGLERAVEMSKERREISPSLLEALEEDPRDELQIRLARFARSMVARRAK
jgi:AraC-like DNA-binding protein